MPKISLFQFVMAVGVVGVSSFAITKYYTENKTDKRTENGKNNTGDNCSLQVKRLSGYKYIKPILFVDEECESADMQGMKTELIDYIEDGKERGDINSAAVYIKDYQNNHWICINGEEKFMPASLMKVPFLITFLKMNEETPGILNKKITFNKSFNSVKTPVTLSNSIEMGKSYEIRELLKYMIKYSDNNATFLLSENINVATLNRVFTEMGLEEPKLGSTNLFMTAFEYSRFMRSLVNGTYLTREDSEYAIQLLTTTVFDKGIQSGLPKNITFAHKFGESGNVNEVQLHESGIVYLNNKPYLITIMTKGSSLDKLSQILKGISSKVYSSFQS